MLMVLGGAANQSRRLTGCRPGLAVVRRTRHTRAITAYEINKQPEIFSAFLFNTLLSP
jgi:hypothetical protein